MKTQQVLLSKIRLVRFSTILIRLKEKKHCVVLDGKWPVWDWFTKKKQFKPFFFSKGYKKSKEISKGKNVFSKIGESVFWYLRAHKTLNLNVRFLGKILKFDRGRPGGAIILKKF